MLMVTCFTFFGLSTIQNLSYFTDFFDGQKISMNLNAQEEENETSNEEEAKEVKEKFDNRNKGYQLAYESYMKVQAERHQTFGIASAFIEVATPPPET